MEKQKFFLKELILIINEDNDKLDVDDFITKFIECLNNNNDDLLKKNT